MEIPARGISRTRPRFETLAEVWNRLSCCCQWWFQYFCWWTAATAVENVIWELDAVCAHSRWMCEFGSMRNSLVAIAAIGWAVR
jgi:hypothetical protein